jgi:hypothetical protein
MVNHLPVTCMRKANAGVPEVNVEVSANTVEFSRSDLNRLTQEQP